MAPLIPLAIAAIANHYSGSEDGSSTGALYGAGINAGAQIYGAQTMAGANTTAAQLSANAATHAADLQSQATAAALAFQKQQAEIDRQTAETTRRANYDQWAAQQRRIGNVGELLGLGGRDVPDYVPLPSTATTATSSTTPAGATSGSSASNSGINLVQLSDPKAWMETVGDASKLTQFVTQSLGSASNVPGLVQYYVGKIQQQPGANETEQRGSASYWLEKMQADPHITGATTTSPATTARTGGQTAMPDYSANLGSLPLSGNLALPNPYQVAPVSAYLGG